MMTREENIFLAKKLFAELVFNTAYIEGVNVTFPQTQTIIDGGVVNNISVDDIQTVLNLRDGWRYMLSTIDTPVTLEYVCKINEFVSRNESLQWGVLRTGNVGISGTSYKPPVPESEVIIREFERINSIPDARNKAIAFFCFSVRGQLFWDGNKRTSTIVASKMLIERGEGILTIDPQNALAFNDGLLRFYDTNDNRALTTALKNCIKSLELPQKKTSILQKMDDYKEKSNATAKLGKKNSKERDAL